MDHSVGGFVEAMNYRQSIIEELTTVDCFYPQFGKNGIRVKIYLPLISDIKDLKHPVTAVELDAYIKGRLKRAQDKGNLDKISFLEIYGNTWIVGK